MLVDGISRKRLRELALDALIRADTLAGDRVYEPRDWPTRPELFPMLLVQTPRDRKVSLGRGIIQFNTTITLVVIARVVAATPEDAGLLLDEFSAQIEDAIFFDRSLTGNVQQFAVVDTQIIVSAEGKQQIGELAISFDCEVYQVFEPRGVPLTGVDMTINNPATGTAYAAGAVAFTPKCEPGAK